MSPFPAGGMVRCSPACAGGMRSLLSCCALHVSFLHWFSRCTACVAHGWLSQRVVHLLSAPFNGYVFVSPRRRVSSRGGCFWTLHCVGCFPS